MIQMNHYKTILSMLAVFVLITTSLSVMGTTSTEESLENAYCTDLMNIVEEFDVSSTFSAEMPSAVAVGPARAG